jgi:DNA-binding response OmpR family regulator
MDQPTVLVVDDDFEIRALISELLEEAGYAVLEAACGQEALRLASAQVPAVVVVDHRLPDLSGLEVVQRLRAHSSSRHIPVMLMSGFAHRLVGRTHGADRIMSKPFDITDLLQQVDALASIEQGSVV